MALPKPAYEKMNATTEAADLIKNSYSTAVKGMQDYNLMNPLIFKRASPACHCRL
jgi:hypothetical protein